MDAWVCEMCAGEVVPMGCLGRLGHGRCRQCGMETSRAVEVPDPDPFNAAGEYIHDEP